MPVSSHKVASYPLQPHKARTFLSSTKLRCTRAAVFWGRCCWIALIGTVACFARGGAEPRGAFRMLEITASFFKGEQRVWDTRLSWRGGCLLLHPPSCSHSRPQSSTHHLCPEPPEGFPPRALPPLLEGCLVSCLLFK